MNDDKQRDYLLGKSLRKARADVGLNQNDFGIQAGFAAGTAKGKVSKIESGEQPPSEDDLDQWARVANAPAPLVEQWKELAAAEVARRAANYKSRLKGGQQPIQQEWTKKAEDTTLFRFFETFAVPRYLQVDGYTRAMLSEFKKFSTVDDLEAAVRERQASAKILYKDDGKTFKFIIDEPVLFRTRFPRAVMRPQLLLLQSFISDEDQLRVYPSLSRPVSHLPISSFELFDNVGYIETEVGGAEPLLYDTVVPLATKFDALWNESVAGDDAREIIARALAALPTA
ncbi:Scr1 family TA system antitoxin-like transcriptional regulator [Paractinoplanes maris]|uniref:Scr1 family TA system antitoxin-like transcriptional regulator n=1 Tax=Paractinoplanes maris TaxID=1734446 RepID=UPI00202125E8|nr:Scr1 family TA system antitoxin-like transcriptional regulator [Actinoplanes maris]